MTAWNPRANDIFLKALEISAPDDRRAFLTQACGGEDELRAQVESLLSACQEVGSFLESPIADPVATIHLPKQFEGPGTQIGPYKLLQQIGEGGMGTVYMAEQSEPVARRVALKIIKPGMDSRQVIARFEAERQALALMDHPNIAKILDAGATDVGRPYFVMELVKGIPIIQYCDERRLTPQQRLQLFITVCQAVQHAHQKGIIHRDIKPTNILVADYDDRPVTKIIDFGVAKAIGQELTAKTMFTEFGQVIGTVEYMSPEQAKLNQLDIDTRTDIYSLGVLLYELLSGETPFDRQRMRSAAFDEMLRIIREEEPPRPSTRLSTSGELPSIAANRHTDPRKLAGLVRGELDWIVMKALEKDRAHRYETANAFAQDIERYLNNEPVLARPTSSAYRVGKLIKRNRLAFAAAASVAVTVLLGGVLSTWQAIRATRSEHEQSRLRDVAETALASEAKLRKQAEADEQKAHTEAAKSQQVATFMKEMLKGVAPWVAMGRDTTMLRDILNSTSDRLDKELKDQPAVEADLRTTLGDVYYDLRDFVRAEAMFRRALDLRKQLYGNEHAEIAESLNNLGDVLFFRKNYTEAEPLHREALAMQKKLFGDEHPAIAETLDNLANDAVNQGRISEGEILSRESLEMSRKLLGNDNLALARSLFNLADIYHQQHQYSQAEPLLREALAIRKKHLGDDDPEVIQTQIYIAWILELQRKFDEAEPMLRQAVEIQKKVYGRPTQFTLYVLGRMLYGQNKLSEAEAADRQAVAFFVAGSINDRFFPELSYQFATILRHEGKLGEAEIAVRRAAEWEVKEYSDQNVYYQKQLMELANVLRDERKLAEAEATDRQLLAKYSKLKGFQYNLPYIYNNLTSVLQLQGRLPEAEAAARLGMDAQKKLKGDQDRFLPKNLIPLANVLLDEGNLAEAESTARDAIVMLKKRFDGGNLDSAKAHEILAGILRTKHQFKEAEAAYREALAVQLEHLFNSPISLEDEYTDFATTLQSLTEVLRDEGKSAVAESLERETLEKVTAAIGADQPLVAEIKGQLAQTLLAEGKAAEAEPLARQAMELEQKFAPGAWQAFRAQYLLGQCLLDQENYADAEPLLQSGYEGMEKLTHGFPAAHDNQIKKALRSLTKLNEATGQSDKAAQWQQKLGDLEISESSNKDVSQTSSNQ